MNAIDLILNIIKPKTVASIKIKRVDIKCTGELCGMDLERYPWNDKYI